MIARLPVFPARTLMLSAKLGLVSVPETGILPPFPDAEPAFDTAAAVDLLQVLGTGLGLTLLSPKPDGFPDMEAGLAADTVTETAFPEAAVRKTLEGLSAVWLHAGEVVAVFALEDGTGRWEGLRRLADLLALHPKLKAALYLVSVPGLKAGLFAEINRPVFRLLKKPLGEAVRILDWSRLKAEVGELGERVRYLKPEFLEGISEVVEPPAG
ncbi:MAG: hypothetical protein ABI036_16955 [Fibrobacteria bacterium]